MEGGSLETGAPPERRKDFHVPDRLPGVVVLKLCWTQIAERGAETASVDLIDKARKIDSAARAFRGSDG